MSHNQVLKVKSCKVKMSSNSFRLCTSKVTDNQELGSWVAYGFFWGRIDHRFYFYLKVPRYRRSLGFTESRPYLVFLSEEEEVSSRQLSPLTISIKIMLMIQRSSSVKYSLQVNIS